jgi:hypothetical protein
MLALFQLRIAPDRLALQVLPIARWEVRPWQTAEGAVVGVLILAEELTRRKWMEEALSG